VSCSTIIFLARMGNGIRERDGLVGRADGTFVRGHLEEF